LIAAACLIAAIAQWKANPSSKYLKTLERVKGIEPSYSAWKSDASSRFFKGFSDKS